MSNLSSVKSEQINESKGSGVDKSVEETENEVATEEELDQLAEVIKKKSERRKQRKVSDVNDKTTFLPGCFIYLFIFARLLVELVLFCCSVFYSYDRIVTACSLCGVCQGFVALLAYMKDLLIVHKINNVITTLLLWFYVFVLTLRYSDVGFTEYEAFSPILIENLTSTENSVILMDLYNLQHPKLATENVYVKCSYFILMTLMAVLAYLANYLFQPGFNYALYLEHMNKVEQNKDEQKKKEAESKEMGGSQSKSNKEDEGGFSKEVIVINDTTLASVTDNSTKRSQKGVSSVDNSTKGKKSVV